MYEFEYHKPTSLDDAAKPARRQRGGQAGRRRHDPDPDLEAAARQARPTWSTSPRSPRCKGITEDGDAVVDRRDDPACRGQPLAESSSSAIPALAALAGMIGDPAVRNRGTIGGSIANNDPAADYPAAVVGARRDRASPPSARSPADDFFTGMFETALEPDEIVTAVRFPKPQAAGYQKFRNPASRYAIVGVFVATHRRRRARRGDRRRPLRVPRARDGSRARPNPSPPDAIKDIAIPDDGLNSDIHASAEYRAHLVNVMARRAVAACA